MYPEQIEDLIQKLIANTATQQEKELLDTWFQKEKKSQTVWEADSLDEENHIKNEMFSVIRNKIAPVPVRKIYPSVYKYVAAASILLFIISISFFVSKSKTNDDLNATVALRALPPGGNGAVLTLASGEKVQLGKNALINISKSKIIGILNYSDSLLEYQNAKPSKELAYNILTTPYGRQFSLVLSDGTKVYMNAGSTLEYPVAFTGSERLVKLSGEAYFEVVHNSKSPFRIKVGNQIIEDIGTSFNVNAYKEENFTSVTLVEGSVKISKKENEVIIKPGQQALTYTYNNVISIKPADFDSALAWKNGLFHFDNSPLSIVLKQIARWYNLEIEYEGGMPTKTIDGEIYRNMDGAQVLSILKNLGVNYKLDGNKLIVKKQ
jgi:transmembrane sensor